MKGLVYLTLHINSLYYVMYAHVYQYNNNSFILFYLATG